MAKAKTTEFVEFKEELLPKLIPAAFPGLWNQNPENPDEEPADDDNNAEEG